MYFRIVLHAGDKNISDLNISIKNSNSIYGYFAKTNLQLEDELNGKYKDCGKQQLKHELRELKKKQNKDVLICFISKLLCN